MVMLRRFFPALVMLCGALAACTSAPQPEANNPDSADGTKTTSPRWASATEEEVAAALDKELYDAAKDLVKLKKDGELMFCKRTREVGSRLPTLKCITTAQLRERVENMTRYRDDMRNKGSKCTRGRSGGPPCGA